MRVLALEIENTDVSADDFKPLLVDEAKKVWEFYQEDVIREIYFRADRTMAVLVLECHDLEEAKQKISELPLVVAGLIDFEFIPLIPYSGFARLFTK